MLQSAAFSYPLPENSLSFYKPEKRTAYNEKPEAELVPFIIEKSERAFTKLYNDYADALYGVIKRLVSDTTLTEDLLQESFIKIWKHADTYDSSKGSIYTWMLNITRHTAIDYLRSHQHQCFKKNVSAAVSQYEIDSKAELPLGEELLGYKELRNKVCSLDEKYAAVIDMIYFYGYSQKQTAEMLKLPLGTIKTRTRKGITLLKKL